MIFLSLLQHSHEILFTLKYVFWQLIVIAYLMVQEIFQRDNTKKFTGLKRHLESKHQQNCLEKEYLIELWCHGLFFKKYYNL